jgi:hypothetical protein
MLEMGASPLRQFLQTLCCDSRWNYGVFWKFHHPNQMLLTWEDGYCDENCLKGSDDMLLLNTDASINDANFSDYQIELAFAVMSKAQYALGEGVVGDAAYTGNYRWVFSDYISGCEFDPNLLSQCPDEWLFQFAAGIKTLLLVPIESYGVLQLGSFETIVEDPAAVAYIKNTFINQQNSPSYSVLSAGNGNFAESLFSMNSSPLDDGLANDNTQQYGQYPLMDTLKFPEMPFDFPNYNYLETMDCNLINWNSEEILEEYLNQTFNSYSDNNPSFQLSFPDDCELHKALGPAFVPQTDERKPPVLNDGPLEATVNDECSGPDESLSNENSNEKSCITSSGQLLSAPPKGQKGHSVKASGRKRKASRDGDNSQKPRPRDRQLIQDRVKELRNLVPNGGKCSIDGLLERTAKHMLFLRKATDQAEQLRHSVHHDVGGAKNMKRSTKSNGGQHSGTSWAYEIGTEQQYCPIVVEDLERPGHMLIEMRCNDNWHFLDISDVIHRLDLTILKGSIESHSDTKWARFIIEAPRGFHRLDIFWPLMRLLQQNRTPTSTKI